MTLIKGNDKWLIMETREIGGAECGIGPMELEVEEENDPLVSLEGKKCQRVANASVQLLETKLSTKKMEIVRLKCDFVNDIDIGAIGSKGGISLGWTEDCNLNGLGFVAKWYFDQSFEAIVRQAWEDPITSVPDKLANAGKQFQFWSRSRNHEQKRHREAMEKRLSDLYDQVPTNVILSEVMIVGLEDGTGRWVSQTAEMLQVASKHFGDLFTASKAGDDDRLLRLVEQKVTESMNDELLKPFTKDEIGHVVKTMAPLKAPGIDGFPAMFCQRHDVEVRFSFRLGCSHSAVCLSGHIYGLSLLLNEAKHKNIMQGALIGREKFVINHLLFADDCIIFGDALMDRAHVVHNIIKEYELISG
ncbi:hypothetical protein PVK06_005105 [Gossypium arboreum]|uniref:Reverse transcriptase n=1 Tax=Gossypium arboreum TaxID=29729 RepID=A0ABR0QUP5_GOSAR|nr:hypothetical protein PVK06_005105 [Gossypium arboreum]